MTPYLVNVLLVVPCIVYAAPFGGTRPSSALRPRQSSSDPSQSGPPQPGPPQTGGLSIQVWAPLVAIIVVILGMIFISCYRRRRAARASSSQAVTATHELTAAQLTGPGSTAATTRRPRRTRRTPSQISTRSLPAYKEDPGDSEMVLARGIEDMQDPMPTLAEDRENPGSFSQVDLHNVSAANLALSFNASTTSQTPLLHSDSRSQDQSQDGGNAHPHPEQELSSPEYPSAIHTSIAYPPQSLLRNVSNSSSHVRSSVDTVRSLESGSEESQRGLLGVGWELGAVYGDGREDISGRDRGREGEGEGTSGGGSTYGNMGRNEGSALSAEELQARGEAPPYFEVVERQGEGVMEMTAIRPGGPTGGQVESGTNGTVRTREPRPRSGFRSFAARISQLMPSVSSQSAATPPQPPPPSTIPLLPPPGVNSNDGQGTVRAASSRTSSAQEPPPPLPPTSFTGTREHTRHRSATSGSGSTTFSAAISIGASAVPPSAESGASLASPSMTSLPPVPRSRSRLANLLSGNASHATIPRPGSSFNTSNLNVSTTSLSSTLISPPLPHTLVRTNFVYPNAGPTTEQMRFISSRESVARFGVPYGRAAEEAVRMDASVRGEEPPPFDWEGEVGGEESGMRGDTNEGGGGEGAAIAEREAGERVTGDASTVETRAPGSTTPFVVPNHPGMERQASQSSSAGSFETAPDDVNVSGKPDGAVGEESKETEWDFEVEVDGHSIPRAGTATSPNLTLPNITITTNLSQDIAAASTVDAAKFAPTPPPTPPAAGGSGLGSDSGTRNSSRTQLVPRIEVAPA